jgi:hypothetical protein
LEVREELAGRHVPELRALRRDGIRRLILLYTIYEPEVLAPFAAMVHRVVVSPLRQTLYNDSATQPAPLLQLVHQWSTDVALSGLLSPAHDPELLPAVFRLLSHPHVCMDVVTLVLEIADQLLPSAQQESHLRRLTNRRTASAESEETKLREALEQRQAVVAPFISELLQHLTVFMLRCFRSSPAAADQQARFESYGSLAVDATAAGGAALYAGLQRQDGRRRKEDQGARWQRQYVPATVGQGSAQRRVAQFSGLELSILARIAPAATSETDGHALIQLLVPFLHQPPRRVPQAYKHDILITLETLVGKFGGLRPHFEKICTLFGALPVPAARQSLCRLLVRVSETEMPELAVVVRHLEDLNAVDKSQADDVPDFERRVSAFEALNALLRTEALTEVQVLPILENYSSMALDEDFTLRTQALSGFEGILAVLARSCNDKDLDVDSGEFRQGSSSATAFAGLILERSLHFMKRAVRSRIEDVRGGGVQLLGQLVNVSARHRWPAIGFIR